MRVVLIVALVARPLAAQSARAQTAGAQTAADLVRGRVIDDSSRAVSGATVNITRGPDRLLLTVKTDSAGHFSSRFENGTGDYLVHVDAIGLKAARRRIQRTANERELVADFTLGRDLTTLATVKVKADKPVRASAGVSQYNPETGRQNRGAVA